MRTTYRHTKYASYLGYITQAIVNNLAPLLFVTFQKEFNISLEMVTFLITMNFGVQIITDVAFGLLIDKMGYRTAGVLAHLLCFLGLLSMGVLPYTLPVPYWGLAIAAVFNAVGGGIVEVLISPLVESLPGREKDSAMSMLHSFYCWGQVSVVLFSTLYFLTIGKEAWRFLPILWSLLPLANAFFFTRVPMCTLIDQLEEQTPLKKLFSKGGFWILLMLMLCAGASEITMSQWSSLFAETTLGVSKTLGDLLGPCAFAFLMGIARTAYGFWGAKIKLKPALALSGLLCVLSYGLTVLPVPPLLSLLGCAMCGLSVGLMWPGTISLAAKYYPWGGTAMFAILALAGDVGCTGGPALAGMVSGAFSQFSGGIAVLEPIKAGLLCAIVFPLLLLLGIGMLTKNRNENKNGAKPISEGE